jgi:prophage DNA circulation protein
MLDKKKDKLGLLAYKKSKKLDALIQELQNTTIGSLNESVSLNTQNINNINKVLQNMQTKIESLSELFQIVFNEDGTITDQAYTTHKHSYKDSTINDTEDGTGVLTNITKETTGII